MGGEMDSIVQVIELLLTGLVMDQDELKSWHLHVDIIQFLEHNSFTEDELVELEMMIKQWQWLMVKTYSALGYNLESPNFETCLHWTSQIAFLGAPWFMDTKLWEQRHQEAKKTCRRT